MQLFIGIVFSLIAIIGLFLPREIEIKLLMFSQRWKYVLRCDSISGYVISYA
jgi:hypothetical protein